MKLQAKMSLKDCCTELELLNCYLKGVYIPMKGAQLFKSTKPAEYHKHAFAGEYMRMYLFSSQIPTFEEYKQSPFWLTSKSYLGMKLNYN